MRLLYHHRTQAEDGQAVHIRSLIQALREEGHEVREEALVTRSDAPSLQAGTGSGRGWSWIRRVPRFVRELAEYGYSIPAKGRLISASREFQPHAIYERYAFGNSAGVNAAASLGLPLMLEVNSPMVLELARTRGLSFPGLAGRVEARIFKAASRVCVVTRVLGDILGDLGVDPARLVVVPNGVHLEAFASPDPPAARAELQLPSGLGPVIGFTGFYRDWHRLDLLVGCLASAGLGDAHLVLIGEGPAEGSIREAAQSAGVEGRVHFRGPIAHGDIPRVLPAFDIGVVPAINPYASPLKLHEYMAAGLACVAPDQANIKEVLTDGRDSLLFEPGDADALRDALVALVQDAAHARSLGARAREVVVEKGLTWQHNARRVTSSLGEVL